MTFLFTLVSFFTKFIILPSAQIYAAVTNIITHDTRILFHKAHLYKSIRFIFTCEKTPIQPIRIAYSYFTCESITNQR